MSDAPKGDPKKAGGKAGQVPPPPGGYPGGGIPESEIPEPVWTYRGYRLKASEFTTAMVHMFRAEVQRANVWRQRLDTTTNWAVVTTGALLSFVFSDSESNPIVIPLNLVLVTMFLVIEARRYRYYELWSYRVRLMETDFFASMLVPPFHPSADWAEGLAEHLLHPSFPISNLEALGRRLRRNYVWIYGIVGMAWMARLALFPTAVGLEGWQTVVERARIGAVPGEGVMALIIVFYLAVITISLATVGLQEAAGEVLPRYGGLPGRLYATLGSMQRGADVKAWFRPARQRQQLLTFIITDRAQVVTQRILADLNRGVTALNGTGMYTGQAHYVLMCALTVTEVPQLKALVNDEDPKAFVIVSPAQEVFGRGFKPLEIKEE